MQKTLENLEDFSEEQQAVELLRTNKALMNNLQHTASDIPGNDTLYSYSNF